MQLTFSAKYKVGDKLQLLLGEHNLNWQGKICKVVGVGIDLHSAAYIVEFADEVFKPCFLKEDLRLVKRKGIRSDATESSLTRSLAKAIKSAPVPSQSCFCLVFGLAMAKFFN